MGKKERTQRREKKRLRRRLRSSSSKPKEHAQRSSIKRPNIFAQRTVSQRPSSAELDAYEARLDAIEFVPRVQTPSVLCHYTTFAGLTGILSSRSFLAGHHLDTNDGHELRASDELAVGVATDLANKYGGLSRTLLTYFAQTLPQNRLSQLTDIFIASFTAERDEKVHWRKYGGGGSGVCLVVSIVDEEHPQLSLQGVGTEFIRVSYDPEHWESRFRASFERVVAEFASMVAREQDRDTIRIIGQRALVALARLTGKAAMSSKVEAWQHEKELRVVAMRERQSSIPIIRVGEKKRRAILLPARSGGRLLAIDEIIVGGNEDPDAGRKRVADILAKAGYPTADASLPKISISEHRKADLDRD
ncbi:MAG TPA: DUF2971 domain-containing protein [Polyangia bacterium]|nr:DUF2971 domain-containing protein [Polyangia bacterium]